MISPYWEEYIPLVILRIDDNLRSRFWRPIIQNFTGYNLISSLADFGLIDFGLADFGLTGFCLIGLGLAVFV